MEGLNTTLEVHAHDARRRRRLDAQFQLLKLDNFERLARRCEGIDAKGSDSPEDSATRVTLAAHFEKAIGVSIEQRHLLRKVLESEVETGERSFGDIIRHVRLQSRKGFSSWATSSGETSEAWL